MLVNEFIKNHKKYIFSRLEMNQTYPNGESPLCSIIELEKKMLLMKLMKNAQIRK